MLADEVYQDNIYGSTPFNPFRKVAKDIGFKTELFSFHSTSKGAYGECGMRAGWVHLENVQPEVSAEMYKLMSINLCSNIPGQIIMACQSAPPKQGEPSYDLWNKERMDILYSLKRKAKIIEEVLNQPGSGISTQAVAGAMYAFPSLTHLSNTAIDAAKAKAWAPDLLWCMELCAFCFGCFSFQIFLAAGEGFPILRYRSFSDGGISQGIFPMEPASRGVKSLWRHTSVSPARRIRP